MEHFVSHQNMKGKIRRRKRREKKEEEVAEVGQGKNL